MTVVHKTKSTTVKMKHKTHPNEVRYAGRPCYEVEQAFLSLLSTLSDTQTDDLINGELVIDQEMTDEFFDMVQKGDVIGLVLFRGIYENSKERSAAFKFKVLDIDHKEGVAKVQDVTFENPKQPSTIGAGKEVEIYYEDFSFALAMGFAEILMRDDKVYGVPEEYEQKVTIHYHEEEKPWDRSVLENGNLTDDDHEKLWESVTAKDFYFNVDSANSVTRCTVTPINYFDDNGARFDQNLNIDKLFGTDEPKFSQATEDVFEFSGTEDEARKILSDLGFVEKQEISTPPTNTAVLNTQTKTNLAQTFVELPKPWDEEATSDYLGEEYDDSDLNKLWAATKANEYYFQVEDDGVDVLCSITPIEFFDKNGYMDDQTPRIDHLFQDKGLRKIDGTFNDDKDILIMESMESVFEFSGTKEEARKFLLSCGFIENNKIGN